MAIKIPSKYIYTKELSMIRDNVIRQVNSILQQGDIVEKYGEKVHTHTSNEFLFETYGKTSNVTQYHDTGYSELLTVTSYSKISWRYNNSDIYIPIDSHLEKIKNILVGVNTNNVPYITYLIYGYKKTGVADVPYTLTYSQNKVTAQVNESAIVRTITDEGELSVLNLPDDRTFSYTESHLFAPLVSSTSTVTIDDKTNIADENIAEIVTRDDGKQYYHLKTKILSGWRLTQMGGYAEWYTANPSPSGLILTGPVTEYEPTSIEINIYGNVYTLQFTEVTQSVEVEDGDGIYLIEASDLNQKDNTIVVDGETIDANKWQADSIIDQYKNGKQTAVISCAVADYYDENAQLITMFVNKRQVEIATVPQYSLSYTGEVSVNNLVGDVISVTAALPASEQTLFRVEVVSFDNDKIIYKITARTPVHANSNVPVNFTIRMRIPPDRPLISVDGGDLPMVFNNGDIVVPYVFTNQGDKPLSYNADFTPKQFKVVGTKISTRQGVTQELTLLEV